MKRIIFLMLLTSMANATDIILNWDTPTVREDGSSIEQIDKYNLYTYIDNVAQPVIELPAPSNSFPLSDVAPGNYVFHISTVEYSQEGALSDPASLTINEKIISKIGKVKITIEAVE